MRFLKSFHFFIFFSSSSSFLKCWTDTWDGLAVSFRFGSQGVREFGGERDMSFRQTYEDLKAYMEDWLNSENNKDNWREYN